MSKKAVGKKPGHDKVITRVYYDRLFDFNVLLVICKWEHFLTAANKYLDRDKRAHLTKMYEAHGYKETTRGIQWPMAGGGSVIWLKPEKRIHNLVHEITHAAHYLLKQRGIGLNDETEEVYAYLVEDIFKELASGR